MKQYRKYKQSGALDKYRVNGRVIMGKKRFNVWQRIVGGAFRYKT